MQNNDLFSLMDRKIIDILIGDTVLRKESGYDVQMPYLKGPELCSLSTKFGLYTAYPTGGGALSRWQYMERLLEYVIERGKTDSFFSYLFDLKNFSNHLQRVEGVDAREVAYKDIISSTFAAINGELFFQNKKFYHNCGRFYVADEKSKNTIESKKLKIIDAPYIHDLNKRIESDMQSEAYDSVITKSRTLIEEVLIFILEQKDFCRDKLDGNILKLYADVKTTLKMQQNKDVDDRINSMLAGLMKIIQAIAEMRNSQSDAHGVGKRRIRIRSHEALLIANSAITFSTYICSVFEMQRDRKV